MRGDRVIAKIGDVAEDFAEVLSHWSEITKRFLTGRWAKVALGVVAMFLLGRMLAQATFGVSLKLLTLALLVVMAWNIYAYARINSPDCHKTGSIYTAATFTCQGGR